MEKLKLLLPLFLLLQVYHPVLVISEPFIFPDRYFINCGSDSAVTLGSRNFVGDKNSNSFFSVGKSNPIKETSQSVAGSGSGSSLYQTARFYTSPFSYFLDINETGLHVVRLHFFPFKSDQANLEDALFNVLASNKSLLSNFSVRNSSSYPVIKDFFVPIHSTNFKIHFIPAQQTSFAFVNAIEVFLVPEWYLEDKSTLVTWAGSKGVYKGLMSQVLRTVHRVIVGGQSLNDSTAIASEWVDDDNFIFVGNLAKNCTYFSGKLNYEDEMGVVQNFIPDLVYRTCKEVNLNNRRATNSTNITWHFNVSKNARYLVRVHFCDILSQAPNTFNFSLFVYGKFSENINPYDHTSQTAVPFHSDYVVDSGDFDFISISVAPMNGFLEKRAYLNGLEIMEFITQPAGWELGESDSDSKKKRRVPIIIGSVVGGLVICGLIMIVFFLLCKKRRKAKPLKTMTSYGTLPFGGASPYIGFGLSTNKSVNPPPVSNLNLKLKIPFAEIVEATNNFDAKLLIGEGGFGKVYKGILPNGVQVAVKRSESRHGQGLPEFQTEVTVLSKIQHRHLVSLIGYCDEGSEMILVYEFMQKGTLRDHLYNLRGNPETSSALSLLTWRQRLEICIGAAKGLHYLHTGLDGGIIHRDVKSTNILLDEQYVAKVADFGLSKSGLPNPDEFSMGVKGSFGYLDPEYFNTLQFTEKSDVYSFGVVLLEVLCARPAIIINSHRKEEINLAEWGLIWLKKGELEKIIDPSLAGEINPNSLRKFSEIVKKCLKPNGASRPKMLDICWDLEYTLQLQRTGVHREPHEDSAIDASLDLTSRPFQCLPSNNLPPEEDDMPLIIDADDGSNTTASGVFSQLRIDGGR